MEFEAYDGEGNVEILVVSHGGFLSSMLGYDRKSHLQFFGGSGELSHLRRESDLRDSHPACLSNSKVAIPSGTPLFETDLVQPVKGIPNIANRSRTLTNTPIPRPNVSQRPMEVLQVRI
jgi:hypothetical protein